MAKFFERALTGFEKVVTFGGELLGGGERKVHPSGLITGLRAAASMIAGGLLTTMGTIEPSLAPITTPLGISMIAAGPLDAVYEFVRAGREGRLPDSAQPEEV